MTLPTMYVPLKVYHCGYIMIIRRILRYEGEIVMPHKAFEALNEHREAQDLPKFANPRNCASGTLKLQDSSEVATRGLDAYPYYVLA